jgi:hypothetical protein
MPNVGLQLRTFEQLAVDAVDGGVGADLTRLTWLRSISTSSHAQNHSCEWIGSHAINLTARRRRQWVSGSRL